MPVPKSKQKVYGQIVGHNINQGKSMEAAKNIADRAVMHKDVNDKSLIKSKKCKGCGKVHKNGEGH